jgi:hypothetical protein
MSVEAIYCLSHVIFRGALAQQIAGSGRAISISLMQGLPLAAVRARR